MFGVISDETVLKVLFAVLMAVQIGAFIRLRQRFDKRILLHRTVLLLLIATVILNINYFLFAFAPNVERANIGIHLSFIFFDVCIYLFYAMVEIFTGTNYKKSKRAIVIGVFQAVDIIALTSSIFTGSMYIPIKYVENGKTMYSYAIGWLFPYFFCITMTVAAIIFFLLIRKTIVVPTGYGKQYISVALIAIGIGIGSFVFLAFGSRHDFSVILIPLAMVIAGYYVIAVSPSQFQMNSRARVIDETSDGIIIFDYNGICTDINKSAQKYFGEDFFSASKRIDEWISKHKIDLKKESNLSYIAYHLDGSPHFRVSVNPYYDPKKKRAYSGTYIRIHDKTVEDLKEEEDRYNSTHDMLTGLLNKDAFFEVAKNYLESLGVIDHYLVSGNIANFKLYNNLFGVEAGNVLLKNIAECLKEHLHEYNLISRMEADRFCVLMPREAFDEREFRLAYADALNMAGNGQYALNAYFGVCKITSHNDPVVVLYNRTLLAAQSIKDHADRYTCFYDEKIAESILETQNKLEEIRYALDNDEFVFFIQPQVSTEGKVIGGEALVRWNHPQKGVMSPLYFIPLMEEHGLIEKLDYKVWDMVCKKLREWKESGLTDQYLSVNISAKDFYYMDIYDTFIKLTEKYGIDREKLRLEITESAVMQDEKKQIGLIDKLCDAGFIVEIDDFGSGYSSLNMLNKLHVDVLKLDMGFLRQSDEDARTKSILANIMHMAKDLNMKTVAEGVETNEQADFLGSIGCDVFQGYLFSPPISVSEYETKFVGQQT